MVSKLISNSTRSDPIEQISNWFDEESVGIKITSYFENVERVIAKISDESQPSDIVQNEELGKEILEAKKRFEQGETVSYEEVFGHSQPDF